MEKAGFLCSPITCQDEEVANVTHIGYGLLSGKALVLGSAFIPFQFLFSSWLTSRIWSDKSLGQTE